MDTSFLQQLLAAETRGLKLLTPPCVLRKAVTCVLYFRATGGHPRVSGAGPTLQVFPRACGPDRAGDRVCGSLHQACLCQPHGVPGG